MLRPRFSRRASAAVRTDPLELRMFPSGSPVLIPVIDVASETLEADPTQEDFPHSEVPESQGVAAEYFVEVNLTDMPAAIVQSLADRFPGATIKTFHSTIENGIHSYDVELVASDSGLLEISIAPDGVIESVEQSDQSETESDPSAGTSRLIGAFSIGTSKMRDAVITANSPGGDGYQIVAGSSLRVTTEEIGSRRPTEVAFTRKSESADESESLATVSSDFDATSTSESRGTDQTCEFHSGSEWQSVLQPIFAGMLTTLCTVDFDSIDRAFFSLMDDLDASNIVSPHGPTNVTLQFIMITVGLVGLEYARQEIWNQKIRSLAISGARTPKNWLRQGGQLMSRRLPE